MLLNIALYLSLGFMIPYNQELEGKWYKVDNDNYLEVWYDQNYCLTFNSGIHEFNIYSYSRTKRTLEFKLIDSHIFDQHDLDLHISKLIKDQLITRQLINGKKGNKETFIKISSDVSTIYDNIKDNEIYLDEILTRAKEFLEAY